MLLALALYASTAHAGIPADSAERPASSTRTRRTTTSSCRTTTGRRIARPSASSFGSLRLPAAAHSRLAPRRART